jgi:Protein chain release factor B
MNPVKLHDSLVRNAALTFSRSGGPGGQNVNKVNTKVHLVIDTRLLEGLTGGETALIMSRLSGRISSTFYLSISVDDERSQYRNREIALERLESLILAACRPVQKRIPTRPGRGAKLERLKKKKIHSQTKRSRNLPNNDD